MISKLIDKFGGVNPMARKIGIPPTTIQSWKNKNSIPKWRFNSILLAAQKYEIDLSEFSFLTANDFYGINVKKEGI